jgi:hypothetical protein
VALDRCLARLAEHVPKECVALFGNPAQPVFTCRGLDRRSQPDVAHHVFARWEAGHGAQHEHRREGRQRAHAGMGHEAPRSGVGVGGLLDLVIQICDVSIEPAQELETLARRRDVSGGSESAWSCATPTRVKSDGPRARR